MAFAGRQCTCPRSSSMRAMAPRGMMASKWMFGPVACSCWSCCWGPSPLTTPSIQTRTHLKHIWKYGAAPITRPRIQAPTRLTNTCEYGAGQARQATSPRARRLQSGESPQSWAVRSVWLPFSTSSMRLWRMLSFRLLAEAFLCTLDLGPLARWCRLEVAVAVMSCSRNP